MKLRPFVVVALALFVAACSALIDPDDVPLRCAVTAEAPNPCPRGMRCDEGVCRAASLDGGAADACVSSEEICDGVDNDCDGATDEGHDVDADGFTWCGGGVLSRADCEDREPSANPDGAEVCDGIDNDCNGQVDEGSLCPEGEACIGRTCVDPTDCTLEVNACSTGEVCDTTAVPPRCTAGDDCRMVDHCSDPAVCDARTGNCVTPSPLGSACSSDTECARGYCALLGATGLAASRDARICAKACCSDADCGAGTICWAAATGAKLCIPPEMVGRQRGTGDPLSSCGSDEQCASGVCAQDLGGCMGNCSADADCGGASCALYGRDGEVLQNACRSDAVGNDVGELCSAGRDCRYGLCYGTAWTAHCSGPCSTTADCPSGWVCTWDELSGAYVQLCYPAGSTGRGAGEPCTHSSECRDFACVAERCWSTCCRDTDCGGGEGRCRAVRFPDDRYEMHCLP